MYRTAILSAYRTPMGSFLGQFSSLSAPQLGGAALKAAYPKEALPIDAVYMGCVFSSGLGQGPARQAAYHADLPFTVPSLTINKVCGSGLASVIWGCKDIALREAEIILAGGMESLSQCPYMLERARSGYRIGHGEIIDLLYRDGLEDAYTSRTLMGALADQTAKAYGISRSDQEKYISDRFERFKNVDFQSEITPVMTPKGAIYQDEPPSKVHVERFPLLKPAFSKEGSITAATSSSLADGAAAICLAQESLASHLGAIGWIVGHATHSDFPESFTTAPIQAIQRVCQNVGWSIQDVDIFEINEAFAMVPLLAQKELKIPDEKLNPYGGACIIGHPLGATGTRLIVTLMHGLIRQNAKKGIACACIGGGEAIAIAVERAQ